MSFIVARDFSDYIFLYSDFLEIPRHVTNGNVFASENWRGVIHAFFPFVALRENLHVINKFMIVFLVNERSDGK